MITDVHWMKRMLSHNMRMPMSVITGYGELMKKGLLAPSEMEEVMEIFEITGFVDILVIE